MKKRKAMLKGSRKGASTITIVRAFGLAMAAFVIVMLLNYWRDVKNDTFLEKNYLARDVALLITAAYASPGELTYCYYLVGNYKGMFDYRVGKSKVEVVDHLKGEPVDSDRPFIEGSAMYSYVDDKKNPLPDIKITGKDTESLAVLQIVKDNSGVKVLKKMVGEDAKPCKP